MAPMVTQAGTNVKTVWPGGSCSRRDPTGHQPPHWPPLNANSLMETFNIIDLLEHRSHRLMINSF